MAIPFYLELRWCNNLIKHINIEPEASTEQAIKWLPNTKIMEAKNLPINMNVNLIKLIQTPCAGPLRGFDH